VWFEGLQESGSDEYGGRYMSVISSRPLSRGVGEGRIYTYYGRYNKPFRGDQSISMASLHQVKGVIGGLGGIPVFSLRVPRFDREFYVHRGER
jgi:hypothetical protein